MTQDQNDSVLLQFWREGVRSFNEKNYWQAHEHWEQGWKGLPPRQKHYVQGLIQAAAVFHLLSLGRPGPAERLRVLALDHFNQADALGPFLEDERRIDIPGLRSHLENESRYMENFLINELRAVLL